MEEINYLSDKIQDLKMEEQVMLDHATKSVGMDSLPSIDEQKSHLHKVNILKRKNFTKEKFLRQKI
jgi:hypothetical protein